MFAKFDNQQSKIHVASTLQWGETFLDIYTFTGLTIQTSCYSAEDFYAKQQFSKLMPKLVNHEEFLHTVSVVQYGNLFNRNMAAVQLYAFDCDQNITTT